MDNAHQWVPCTVYGTHKPLFSANFSLKIGPMVHTFKNDFVTVFSVFSKISGIQTDPKYAFGLSLKALHLHFFFFGRSAFSSNQWVPCTVHETHKSLFSTKLSLKMGLMILFTHLKIILLQCFQFSAK